MRTPVSVGTVDKTVFSDRAADPHSFLADPDPVIFLSADPDPAGISWRCRSVFKNFVKFFIFKSLNS